MDRVRYETGSTRHMQVESVPTGSLSLDLALGVGGYSEGTYRGDLRSGVQW